MLSELQKDIIINTMLPFNPVRIGIFGSVARGEDTENSDIDILYLFNANAMVSLLDLSGIKIDLEEKLNKKVDLVSEKYIHHKLKPYIMEDLKIIYYNDR